ncbi:PREDICTED: TNF receptor-associated factor 1 [Charadrius vociferus]|uniref:TNF receptor-associated factor 1 n=1 Tax=Charadrius vociferus TaxID=50402 RepID=UPI000521605A|nr:PREDICTED: TNF receptor-associated factor 1 [Charadrius vociferus]
MWAQLLYVLCHLVIKIKPDETKSEEIERIIAKGMNKNFLHSRQSNPYKGRAEEICICDFLSSDPIPVDRVAACDFIVNLSGGKEDLLLRAKLSFVEIFTARQHLKRICMHYFTRLALASCCEQPLRLGAAGGTPAGFRGTAEPRAAGSPRHTQVRERTLRGNGLWCLLQMAEKTTRGPQDVPGSSPDENEFPFGYPTSICEDVPDQKYLCSNCNNVLKKALQTLCGHRYCSACLSWVVRNNKNAICQKCKEEDPSILSGGSLLAEERAFGDAAINKEISELKVHCVTLGCSWSGIMKNFEEHQSLCEYALIPCHTGCGHMVMRKKLADHLENGCVNNVTMCQKCKRSLSSSEYQNLSTPLINKDGCRFSEVGCSFRGSKEKIKEHEKTAVGAHMLLLLQHIKQLKASLSAAAKAANGFIPQSELNVNGAGKSISDLQIPGGLESNGDLEVDCFPGSSVSEDESVLQQLVREKVISELENKLHVFENIVAVLNKEVETSNLEITAFRRQSELDQNIIRGLELKVAELHRCLTQKDAGLSSLHKSLLFSEQASYDGVFLWKITDVGRKLQDSVTGRTVSLYSPAFYTAKYGYKVCLRVYLNGDGTGKGTHVSLFFVVMKGDYDALLPWPFRHKVTFMLLDQNNREHIIDAFRPDLTSASFQRPVNDMNVASGCPMFLPLSKLQSPKYAYVKEDTLFLKCIIETN